MTCSRRGAPEHYLELGEAEYEAVCLVDQDDLGVTAQLFGKARRHLQTAKTGTQYQDSQHHTLLFDRAQYRTHRGNLVRAQLTGPRTEVTARGAAASGLCRPAFIHMQATRRSVGSSNPFGPRGASLGKTTLWRCPGAGAARSLNSKVLALDHFREHGRAARCKTVVAQVYGGNQVGAVAQARVRRNGDRELAVS